MLHYSPETGEFVWLQITTSRVKIGDIAGAVNSGGYVSIGLYGRRYYAHRLAWLYVTGYWPETIIDHRDRQRNNNRFANLRLATDTENAHNASIKKNNTSGVPGVSWCKQSEK